MKKELFAILFLSLSNTLAAEINEKQSQRHIKFISPLLSATEWNEQAIKESYLEYPFESRLDKKVNKSNPNPSNQLVVIQSGERYLTLMDGDKLTPVHRFSTQSALQGKPLFDTTRRYMYFLTKDGWLSKFDSYRFKTVAKIRLGITSSGAAISSDNKFIIIGNSVPNTLVILNASNLKLVKIIPVKDKKGLNSGISSVRDAPPSHSFIISLKDSPKVWEINYENPPPAGFGTWVHDYRKDSGEAIVRLFPIRKIKAGAIVEDFFFDKDYVNIISISSKGEGQVIDLDLGRKVADLDVVGIPKLSTVLFWRENKKTVLAMSDIKKNTVNFIDTKTWETTTSVPTLGPGVLADSPENSPYIWSSIVSGEHAGKIQVIDKKRLEIIKTLQPLQRKKAINIEFTKNGRYAFISSQEDETAMVVYEATTLKKVSVLP